MLTNKPIIVNKDYLSSIDNVVCYKRDIILPETIYEGDRWIKFSEPLTLTCYYIDTETHGYKVATFEFDFGMTHSIALEVEHNCILRDFIGATDEEKIAFDVIFDLFHAFFHPSVDPNYEDYHWALYGNLKDRVEIGENDDTDLQT